jgi:endonuclease YncB( thermonuclease family)
MRMTRCGACVALVLTLASTPALAADWQTLTPCRLAGNDANDGDSFHVRCPDGEERIFRLYFVDAPESDETYPERLAEQAEHFGIAPEDAVRHGKDAAKFTHRFLREPFIVQTKLSSALGRSKLPRYYGIVTTTNGVDLAATLASNGLARVYGEGVGLPDGTPSKERWAALRQAEAYARQQGLGAWKDAKGGVATVGITEPSEDPRRVVLAKTTMVFSEADPPRPIGMLRAGTGVLVGVMSNGWVRVEFPLAGSNGVGRCRAGTVE